jgi:hypothetical protein
MTDGRCGGRRTEAESCREEKTPPRGARGVRDYVVEIEGWDWGYSLSLNTEKHPVDPALKVMGGRNTERLSPRLRHNRCKVSTEDML